MHALEIECRIKWEVSISPLIYFFPPFSLMISNNANDDQEIIAGNLIPSLIIFVIWCDFKRDTIFTYFRHKYKILTIALHATQLENICY